MRASWPLIGRDEQYRRVRELIVSGAHGVVIAGAAGVGKTRLGLECIQWAEASGIETAQVTATRTAQHLPLGALAALLPGGDHGETNGVDSLADYLRRSASALAERSKGGRLLLVVDDAHLLDDMSAILLHQLMTTSTVFVLVNVRNGEAAPDPIVAMWKDDLVERIELGPLSQDWIEGLLTTVLGAPVERGTVARLAARCDGNVMFLRELVIGAVDDGALVRDGGIWRLVGPLSPSLRLIELVEARLGALAPAARKIVEVLSFGEPLGPAELESFGDLEVVEGLERRGIISSRQSGRRLEIGLAHPTYGEVVRLGVPGVRARAILRSLGEAVEATGAKRREDTLRIGAWLLDAGGGSAEQLLAAAVTARWRYDFALAERLARAALASGAGFPAALLASRLAGLQGRSEEAALELELLVDQCETDAERAAVAITRLDNQSFWFGDPGRGIEIATEAEATISDLALRDEIAARRSGIIAGTDGPRQAAAAAEPLIAKAEGRAFVLASIFGGYSLTRLGRLADGRDASLRGQAAHKVLEQPIEWDPCMHQMSLVDGLAHGGRFAEAMELALEGYNTAVASGNTEAQGWFAWTLGRFACDRADVKTAILFEHEAVAVFRQLGRPQMVKFCLTSLAMAQALLRQVEPAQQSLAAIDELELPPSMYAEVDLLHSRAWVAAAGGDLPSAAAYLDDATDLGIENGDQVAAASALHSLARIGHPERALDRLTVLASEVDGVLVQARLNHTKALIARDPDALEEVSLDFESMEAWLLASEALADAAVAWHRMGRPRSAGRAQRRLGLLEKYCEGVETPALLSPDVRARLTVAEREVALLAAAGLSNKEIAGQLSRSVRTVENILQHVYQKFGISSRNDLSECFGDQVTSE